MITIIFVHGTGVRESSYSQTFGKISQRVTELKNSRLYPCYWGGEFGVTLHQGGASIPDFDQTKGMIDPPEEDCQRALWSLLYQDPLYELRLLTCRPAPDFVPGTQPGEGIDQ